MLVILVGGIAAGPAGCRAAGPPASPEKPATDRGPAVELSIALPRDAFGPGEKIEPEWTVTNRSDRPVTLWSCGFWPNHRLVARARDGTEAPLSRAGRERRAAFRRASAKKNVPIVLLPGEQARGPVVPGLDELYELTPGTYAVELEYDDRSEPTPLHLLSNRLAFSRNP